MAALALLRDDGAVASAPQSLRFELAWTYYFLGIQERPLPATQRDDVSCATCQLCQRPRDTIVGFPAHGSRHRVINLRLAA